jgi:isocitrate lyase
MSVTSLDAEEQQYQAEVAEVKKWWSDSRFRYTKRPFTAEQIVAKRGNLRIEYPSNQQSKKLWKILEGRFKVHIYPLNLRGWTSLMPNRTERLVSPMAAWIPLWSPKWQSTLTQSTFPDGNALQLLHLVTSLVLILQITLW